MSSYKTVGPIDLVLRLAEVREESDLIAVHASAEREDPQVLSVLECFQEEVSQEGLDNLLGLEDWEDLPGLYCVWGHLWYERIDSVNYGTDYDGGFEVEGVAPLSLDVLVDAWLAEEDRAHVKALCGLQAQGRARAQAIREVLDVYLETLQGEGASCGSDRMTS